MEHVLYGAPGSGASIAEAALCEAGLAYDYRRVDMEHAAQRAPDYAAVNPHRKVASAAGPSAEAQVPAWSTR